MKIILIRHGFYPGNEVKKLGKIDSADSGLTELGMQQIRKSAAEIKEIVGESIGKSIESKVKIISSPLTRTAESAIILDKCLGAGSIIFEKDLEEFRLSDHPNINYHTFIEAVTTKSQDWECESVSELTARFFKIIHKYVEMEDCDYLIVSTHGGPIMCTLGKILGADPMTLNVENAEYFIFNSSTFF
jgi:broad specificity phosphatase PhoE